MKLFYIVLGCISLGVGAVGAVLPILPAFPFLMLAAFCFARSSEKLHSWFIHTQLYQKNLASFVHGKGMTKQAKFRVLTAITLTMGLGFLMMGRVPVGRIVLAVVWVLHVIYFAFGVRTISPEEHSVVLDALNSDTDAAA